MRPNRFYIQGHIVINNVSLILMFLLFSMTLIAQTPRNFSGKWQFDKTKSILDKVEPNYDGTVVLEINQNSTTITFSEIYIRSGSPDWKTAADSYKLDGKEHVRKYNVGTNKNSVKWSKDKKILTITNIDTQTLDGVTQEFLVTDSYKLSDDGKTLTIERYRKNPITGEIKAKKVYLKKSK